MMKRISSIFIVLPMVVVLALTAACGQASTSQPDLSGTTPALPAVTVAPTTAQPADAGALPTQPASMDSSTTPAVTQEESTEGFNVVLDSPEEVTVDQPEYVVSGQAPVETVVTVNDDIVLVGADKTFSVKVPLEEGPNLIEVVASNTEGQETQFDLIVTYQPAS